MEGWANIPGSVSLNLHQKMIIVLYGKYQESWKVG